MLIKFESKGAASFEMLSEHAVLLVSLMGQGKKTEGSISGELVAAALTELDAGLRRLESEQQSKESLDAQEDAEDEDSAVNLSTRAVPLKELLSHAAKNDTYLMWRPA